MGAISIGLLRRGPAVQLHGSRLSNIESYLVGLLSHCSFTVPELILRGRNRLSSLGDLTGNSSLPKENLKASTLLARILQELYLKTINYMGYLGDYSGLGQRATEIQAKLADSIGSVLRFCHSPRTREKAWRNSCRAAFWLLLARLKRQP